MKSNSDTLPQSIVKSNGKIQVRYDIVEVTREDMNRNPYISYDFSYVEIEGELTREKIINAIIEETHSKDSEIALINNKLLNSDTDVEYAEYQVLRECAKEISWVALGNIPGSEFTLEEVKERKLQEIKSSAESNITSVYPIWRQININELQNHTQEEKDKMWSYINDIRTQSDTLEEQIKISTSIEETKIDITYMKLPIKG